MIEMGSGWNVSITLLHRSSSIPTGMIVESSFLTSTQQLVQMTSQAQYGSDLRLARNPCCVIDWEAPRIDWGEKSREINLD